MQQQNSKFLLDRFFRIEENLQQVSPKNRIEQEAASQGNKVVISKLVFVREKIQRKKTPRSSAHRCFFLPLNNHIQSFKLI